MNGRPQRMQPSLHQKIWGVRDLGPWFPNAGGRVGEVWFDDPGPEPLPILVKFVFTSERLSVQVHPDDEYARAHEGSRGGKSEMWYILRAEPGATMAAGFREPITRERAREASLSGEIEHLLEWFPVSAGQVYYLPSRMVHALGGGVTLCEIQQNNPITYRLYDYGRPRELHLERGLDVARLEPYGGPATPEGNVLVSCPYFVTEKLSLTDRFYQPDSERFHLLIVLEGSGRIGGERFAPGEVWHIPPGTEPFPLVAAPGALLLRASVP